jgi:dTDP-glucose 4,6-dehydratase
VNDTIVVTGGAGFIGSAVVRRLIREHRCRVVTVDALTYSGNVASLGAANGHARHRFERLDIGDRAALRRVLERHRPRGVIHLAGQSHVDRSITHPGDFVDTNVLGTFALLEEARRYWHTLAADDAARFRLLHVSTDEVYGAAEEAIHEGTPYAPTSPYAATKAASDHLVHAWHHSYGLPVLTTHCSTNYGPYQYPEKLIPRMILHALAGKPLPVYGDGSTLRDWLYVEDHADALLTVFERGRAGERYCVGGHSERRNIDVVRRICGLLDELAPEPALAPRESLIHFVADRPGDGARGGLDASRIERELGWHPRETFESGLRATVAWYLRNRDWWRSRASVQVSAA